MDYYEELGLTPNASAEEIRRAYKRLAMQYHPDRRSTDVQRRWAETQMKRLNQIFEILSSPTERVRYDETLRNQSMIELADRQMAEELFFRRRQRIRVWAAAMIGLVMIAGGIYFVSNLSEQQDRGISRLSNPPLEPEAKNSTSPVAVTKPPTPKPETPPSIQSTEPRKEVVKSEAPPAPAAPIESSRREPARSDPAPSPFVEPPSEIAPAPVAARIPSVINTSLTGTWIFSVMRAAETKLPYAAEYVEISISTLHQRISGRFQGRYNVRTSTLPPRVQFRFEGDEQDQAKGIAWRSENGAEGVIKFHLLSEKELEVGWYTTRFASTPALTSGNAILARDPSEH